MTDVLIKNKPREQAGRDTISRFALQRKSTAIASLQLLSNSIDYIYCDLHDDFAIRKKINNIDTFSFYQVKTKDKGNVQWGTNDLCKIKEAVTKKYEPIASEFKNSFVGKLLLHTITFDSQCESVTFQTNIHNKEIVDKLFQAIQTRDTTNKHLKLIINIFNTAYNEHIEQGLSEEEILNKLQKLKFETDIEYLKPNNSMFESYCHNKMYDYAEIEYSKAELKEITLKLLNLVESKSSGVITEWTLDNINQQAGISLPELLIVLGISYSGYLIVKESSDSQAIKTTSILQRFLKKMDVHDDETIHFIIKCKLQWDEWLMTNRQILPTLQLIELKLRIQTELKHLNGRPLAEVFARLKPIIEDYPDINLTKNDILGAFFAEIVKSEI